MMAITNESKTFLFLRQLTLLVLVWSIIQFCVLAKQSVADEGARDAPALIKALKNGGYVIYFRHATTVREASDPNRVIFSDCATQRNLSEDGRAQAVAIGDAIDKLGIKISSVLSSPYCRSIDTAKLAFGRAEVSPDLAFTFGDEPSEVEWRTSVLRRLLSTRPETGMNTVIVSHTANLKEAADIWPKPEGVAHVFAPQGDGTFQHLGQIEPQEWSRLANMSNQK